ncbi:undecaprenyl-phosphate glucose phosphotransferase [Filimonas effusa]|uniref:Undecaprenyl-phosphate glucose phosphotransferase n=1 Tax=Filimonas effusa TaxID=2508721 RepID=A0A4Q1DEC1_9BACT|nr:undecaprenyl-phosphate glucose phosphotransferase [Filimonas effusa]RXK87338.1 undecaprenyl-phosphate glucose phosphotransferase [Filimonas effusa]
MGTRFKYLLRSTLMTSDFIIVNGSWILSYFFLRSSHPGLDNHFGILNFLLFNFCWLLSATFLNLYKNATLSSLENVFRQTWKTAIVHISFFAIVLLCKNETEFYKSFLLVFLVLLTCFFIVSRFLLTYIVEFIIDKAKLQEKTAIIGYNEIAVRLAQFFGEKRSMYSFEGYFDDIEENSLAVNQDGKIVGSIKKCIDFAVENGIREVYSTILPHQHNQIGELLQVAERNCVRVKFVGDFKHDNRKIHHIEYVDNMPVISLQAEPLQDWGARAKKKIFDVVISGLAIVLVLSWLVPIIAILIKLSSRGPVFFKQLRSGKNNQPFWCYKFRSMRIDNPDAAIQASKGDKRITKIGAFLRKTSLDEFPQFFNVFMGDMSIVGPRPHMLKHTEQYSAIINRYMVRQFLKPGITGWAQVKGYRGETRDPKLMEKRVEHDIWYMENWSLMLDIKIIFMTVINIFKGEETAY